MSAESSYAEGVTGTKDTCVGVPVWLLESVSVWAVRVYLQLALRWDGAEWFPLDRPGLASELETSSGTVWRGAKELLDAGAIIPVRHGRYRWNDGLQSRVGEQSSRVGARTPPAESSSDGSESRVGEQSSRVGARTPLGGETGSRVGEQSSRVGEQSSRVGEQTRSPLDTNAQVSGTGPDSAPSSMNHGFSSHEEVQPHDHERLVAEFAGRLTEEIRHRFYGEDHNGRVVLGRLCVEQVTAGWRPSDLTEALARHIAAEQARRGVRVVTGCAISHLRSGRLGPPPVIVERQVDPAAPLPPPPVDLERWGAIGRARAEEQIPAPDFIVDLLYELDKPGGCPDAAAAAIAAYGPGAVLEHLPEIVRVLTRAQRQLLEAALGCEPVPA